MRLQAIEAIHGLAEITEASGFGDRGLVRAAWEIAAFGQ